VKKRFLKFLTRLGRGKVKLGIRHFLFGGKSMCFLNTPMRFLGWEHFPGVKNLHELAKELGRPIAICSWFRDEYGTSDGAYWGEIGVTINPDSTEAELLQITEKMGERVSAFVAVRVGDPSVEMVDPDPIKL
jgi:hypothetical protein